MKPAEASKLLALLLAAFPRMTVHPETLAMYTIGLSDAELEHGARACASFCVRGSWFPTIRELREQIAIAAGDGVPDPDQAWGEVLRAVSRFGAYRDPVFSHPAITSAVESLTWREICLSDNVPALRAHFAKAYEATKKRATDPAHVQLVENMTRHLLKQLGDAPALAAPVSTMLPGKGES